MKAPPKFKVGDRVRWKLNTMGKENCEGFGVITKDYGHTYGTDFAVDNCAYMLELSEGDELELEQIFNSPLYKALG